MKQLNSNSNKKSTKGRGLLKKLSSTAKLTTITLLLSITLAGNEDKPASAVYDSTSDLYIELIVSDTEILPPDTAAGNYITNTTYDTFSRSLADNWPIITIIALVTIGLAVLVVYLVRRQLKKTGLKSTSLKNIDKDTNTQFYSSTGSDNQHLNIELDPNTEIINVAKLLKHHKAKRILLQITPVLAFTLVGFSASWAIIQSYAATLPGGSADLTCTSTSASSCTKFLNDTEDNPLVINLVRSSLIGTGTITLTGQTEVLLQNITNVTGSMDLQAHLAQDLPDNKITNVKLNNSANLTLNPISIIRTNAGINSEEGTMGISLTVDKSIADGEYLIKISTTLVPDTMQTFDKTLSVYSEITAIDNYSTTQDIDNATVTLPDARDNKLYRIRKFTTHANNTSAPNTTLAWWWMIDNLAFDLENQYAPSYSPAVQHIVGGQELPTAAAQAQYITTGGALLASMGYLYDWCAATADTSTNCADSNNADSNVTMPNSICPAGTGSSWRLPRSNSNMNFNDFAWLNNLMSWDPGPSPTDWYQFVSNWLPTGLWQGSFSGYYYSYEDENGYLGSQSVGGSYWSSTAAHTDYAYYLSFFDEGVYPVDGDGAFFDKDIGYAVRCVI